METNKTTEGNSVKDIEALTEARRIYPAYSCTKYCGDKEGPQYKERKKEWNKAKALVAKAVADATPENKESIKAFAKVKPNGQHKAGHAFTPVTTSVLFESMEQERLEYLARAREILNSGTRAGGIMYHAGHDKVLDSYVMRSAKQDGLIREPLPGHPVQPAHCILSLNDNLEYKADTEAAKRWLSWRNESIEYFNAEVTREVRAQMDNAVEIEREAAIYAEYEKHLDDTAPALAVCLTAALEADKAGQKKKKKAS